ncbi:PAS domain-containing protein [Methanosarcina hadiensis]|uniref:PAS domain-containing protein n=1 Tax=Methanosarcina hadiensis TaxID=3078083 RepID=UPI003977D09B
MKKGQSPAVNFNPVISVEKDGTVLYSNEAGKILLQELDVRVGEKLPSYIGAFVQRAISREGIEKIEIKIGKKIYFFIFYPLPEHECVNVYGFDTGDRKKFEGNLRERETQEKIDLELANIIDVKSVQSLMNDFYKLAHTPMALLDLKGNILVSAGWHEICTRFHRVNPEACKHCIESDTILSAGVAPGGHRLYKCKNNLWDAVTPIIVEGQHIGNIFSGQFFLDNEPLNYEIFRSQASKYGFNEEEYIKALEKVPRLSREAVDTSMTFFMTFANMISQLSYGNIKLSRSLDERDSLVAALRESYESFRSVLENSLDSAYRLDFHQARFDYMSPVIEQITGFSPEEIDAMTRNDLLDRIHPDDLPLIVSGTARSLDEGFGTHEYRFKCKNGEYRWLADHFSIIKDKTGVARFRAGIVRDITEKKQAEKALSFSNLYNRSLIEASLDPLVTIGHNGKITDVNGATEKVTGYSRRELIGTDFSDYFTEPEKAREGYQQAFTQGEVRDYTLEIRHKDGYITPVLYNASVYRDRNGEIIGVFAAARDITERKRIEEALLESESRLRLAQIAAGAGIWNWDISTDRLEWSEELFRLFDLDPRENDASFDLWRSLLHPDDRLSVENRIATAINNHNSILLEYRIILPSAEVRWINALGSTTYDSGGKPQRVSGICIDITERKKAEEALKKTHDNLEKLVEERTIELEKAYESLKESKEGLAEAQKMAHIGNWSWDFITGETCWSEEMYRIFRLNSQESSPIHREIFNYIHPDDRDYVDSAIKKAVKEKPLGIDYRIITADRKERTVHAESEIIFDQNNNPIRAKGIIQDITERKETEGALANIEIARKKEIHHRIKNNLQVISSLLDLQADKFDNPKVIEAFRESQNRVISMALIHEELYKGEGTDTLNFSTYIRELAENLFQTYSLRSKNILLYMDMEEDVFLDMDTAVPLGIIVNELISNSLKHVFSEQDRGEIRVKLYREKNRKHKKERDKVTGFVLAVSDNGTGIPESLNIENTDSLGIQLINTLVNQLDGGLELKRDNGTEFTIRFKVAEKNQAHIR